jgi:hypothetical protein
VEIVDTIWPRIRWKPEPTKELFGGRAKMSWMLKTLGIRFYTIPHHIIATNADYFLREII